MPDDSDIEFMRICLTGPAASGKSCLAVRFLENEFENVNDPTIEDTYYHKMTVDDKPVKLEILDISGEYGYCERYKDWFPKSDGFLCIYSITDREFFEYACVFPEVIRRTLFEAKKKTAINPKKVSNQFPVPVVLVGTQKDKATGKRRKVTVAEGQEAGELLECPWYETSAVTGENVPKVFEDIVRQVRLGRKQEVNIANSKGKRKNKSGILSGKSIAVFHSKDDSSHISDTKGQTISTSSTTTDVTSTATSSEPTPSDQPDGTKASVPSPEEPAKPDSGFADREEDAFYQKKSRYFVIRPYEGTFSVHKTAKTFGKNKKPQISYNLDDTYSLKMEPEDKKLKYPTISLLPPGPKAKPALLGFKDDSQRQTWFTALQCAQFRDQVFGAPMTVLAARTKKGTVPAILTNCIDELVKRDCLTQVGIYRISAKADELHILKNHWNTDGFCDPAMFDDHNVFSAGLKLWLRELPEPLLQFNLYNDFIGGMKKAPDDEKRVVSLASTVKKMRPINRATLSTLIAHLVQVFSHRDVNKMTSHNLAIVFAPTILRAPEEEEGDFNPQQMLMDMKFQQQVVDLMIKHADVIFAET